MRLSNAILIGIVLGLLFYIIFAPLAYIERGCRFDLGGEFMGAILIMVMTPAFIKDREMEQARKRRIARERAGRREK